MEKTICSTQGFIQDYQFGGGGDVVCGSTGMGEYFSQVTPRNGAKSIVIYICIPIGLSCRISFINFSRSVVGLATVNLLSLESVVVKQLKSLATNL